MTASATHFLEQAWTEIWGFAFLSSIHSMQRFLSSAIQKRSPSVSLAYLQLPCASDESSSDVDDIQRIRREHMIAQDTEDVVFVGLRHEGFLSWNGLAILTSPRDRNDFYLFAMKLKRLQNCLHRFPKQGRFDFP